MQSKTSLFNPTLFQKNLTRFWPIWALYGVLWVLILPGTMLSEYFNGWFPGTADSLVMSVASDAGILLAFGFGCITALAVFSYLYQHRSAVAMHAFPLRRECLFVTNYLSGLAFFILPLAVVFVLTIGAEAICGAVNVSSLLVWFTAQIGYVLCFYSFAVFCAMFTGNAFAMPIFYGILSVLAPAMAFMADAVFQKFVYGYVTSGRINNAALTLSPVAKLLTKVRDVQRILDEDTILYYMSGWGWIILYALVGIAFAVCALLVYRRRQVESAGDVVSVAVVRPLFKYGVAVCAAFTFGAFLFEFFFHSDAPNAVWIMLALMIVCGGVGYFVAQMLLSKSFRVFTGHWKGFGLLTVLLAAMVAFLYFDPVGLVTSVPKQEQVQFASLQNVYTYGNSFHYGSLDTEEAETIARILELHETILEQRSETERTLQEYDAGSRREENQYRLETGESLYVDDSSGYYFEFQYTLTSGRTMTRGYEIYVSNEELADPDSPAARLTALINDDVWENGWFSGTEEQVVQAEVRRENPVTYEWETESLDQDEARILFAAVQEDLKNGAIGRGWLTDSQECQANHYLTDIEFSFTKKDPDGEAYLDTETITVQTTSKATIAALNELGVVTPERPLVTEWERRLAEAVGYAAEKGILPEAREVPLN